MATGNATTVNWHIIDDARLLAAATSRVEADVAADDVAAFRRDGVVVFRNAFTQWVEPLRAGLQRTLDEPEQFAFRARAAGATSRAGSSTVTAAGSSFPNTSHSC